MVSAYHWIVIADGRRVDVDRVADRLADVERLEERELVAVLAHELGEPEQHALAVGRLLVGPAAVVERGPGGRDGPRHVLRPALGDLARSSSRRAR